ncbi:hypothetical protein HMPREF3198_00380 [Winkia neuii]|nr:hypothetical protein HMPREF3198_00380 [Winkia neuii]
MAEKKYSNGAGKIGWLIVYCRPRARTLALFCGKSLPWRGDSPYKVLRFYGALIDLLCG